VASLQDDSVGVATALSPVGAGHFKFYHTTSIVGLGLKLSGKKLEIDSYSFRVGVPEVRMLRPRASLYSRLVTIKGFMESAALLESAKRQLQKLGVSAEIQLGERRTLRVKDKQVVGFEVAASELDAEDSLRIQESGLGGRRHMGCGVFVPLRR
jgi:CRISPR-associated protein Cas6